MDIAPVEESVPDEAAAKEAMIAETAQAAEEAEKIEEDIQSETAKAAESLFNGEEEAPIPCFEEAGVLSDLPGTDEAEQPVITIEEDNSTVEIPEPQIRDAKASEEAVKETAETAAAAGAAAAAAAVSPEPAKAAAAKQSAKPKKKKSKSKKPLSVLAVLSLIFSLIGLVSGGYACLFTFMDFGTAAVFFIPSVIAIVLGLIALTGTGKDKAKRGKPLAIAGLLIGVLSIALWIVGAFFLHHLVKDKYGNEDLMSAIRAILSLR